MSPRITNEPTWQRLYEIAAAQDGQFTTQQAATAGYSRPLLHHHEKIGRIAHVRRGIYRLVHFPPGDHEELVTAWLWSDSQGIISHQTALTLHGLSDLLVTKVHVTLPLAWRRRRFREPEGFVLHHGDVPTEARTWFGSIPMTSAQRTLNDCALVGLSPDLLRQAAQQALRRGLVTRSSLDEVENALEPFGGI